MKYHLDLDIELLKNPYKGKYIAVEGPDGSGKTTQVKRLAEYFKKQGKEVVLTREPRKSGIIGDLAHKVLLGEERIPPKAFQYLFTADRVIHYEDVIIPALKSGKIVISDRCFWSALVYGILDKEGNFTKKNLDFILVAHSILSMYHQFIIPDFTFYLRIPLKAATSRIKNKQEKIEVYETEEKIKRAVSGYEWLLKQFGREIASIDGTLSKEQITKEMIGKIAKAI